MKNMSAPDTDNIFEKENINTKLNLRNYKILPNLIKWKDISIDTKYDELLKQALDLYHINNPPESKHEKFVAKLTATPLIMDRFEKLEAALYQHYNEYLEDHEVDSFIKNNDPTIADFGQNLQNILIKYVKKLRAIKKAWYEDWRNFGNMNDYTPIASKIRKLPKANRAKIVSDAKSIYQNLLNTTKGDERNNPLKYWIINEVQPALDSTSRIGPDERPEIVNAEMYSPSLILSQLKAYLEEIPSIPDNNILAAYYKITEILDWVSEFGDITYNINSRHPYSFYERIGTLKIDDVYRLDVNRVKTYLKKIYDEFGVKLNTTNLSDFVQFMKILNAKNKHFESFNNVHEILFEIYAICQNGDKNKANFNINSIVDGYREWQRSGRIDYGEGSIEGREGILADIGRLFTRSPDRKKKTKEDAYVAAVKKSKADEGKAKYGFGLFDGKPADELVIDDEYSIGSISEGDVFDF